MKDYVTCEICGWRGRQITTGHLREHSIRANDYKIMYPNSDMTCEMTKAKMSEKAKLRPPQTEEKKKQISESMKKVYRETDFTLRNRNENQDGDNNHFYGKNHSEQSKRIIGKKSTEWLLQAYKDGKKISPFKYLGKGKEMSSYEEEIHKLLSPLGFIYDYEIPFNKGSYLIDFANTTRKIAIELDSTLHLGYEERDKRKDSYLKEKGWSVYRFKFSNGSPIQIARRIFSIVESEVLNGEESNLHCSTEGAVIREV